MEASILEHPEKIWPQRAKVLMVDDQPRNLLALEAVLDKLDHDLVRANSGQEALRCLMSDDFAVILLDIQMPDMDGYETASLIRSREKSRYSPIVFLTAVGKTAEELQRGYQVGALDYLLKPFDPEVLRSKVKVLVELYQKSTDIERMNEDLLGSNDDLRRRAVESETALHDTRRLLTLCKQKMAVFVGSGPD